MFQGNFILVKTMRFVDNTGKLFTSVYFLMISNTLFLRLMMPLTGPCQDSPKPPGRRVAAKMGAPFLHYYYYFKSWYCRSVLVFLQYLEQN